MENVPNIATTAHDARMQATSSVLNCLGSRWPTRLTQVGKANSKQITKKKLIT